MSERLQLKRDAPAGESLSCPGCGKPLAVGAVLCVQCGYDTRIGRRVGGPPPRRPPALAIGVLLLAILVAGIAVYLRSLDDGVRPSPPPPPAEPPASDPAPAPESAPEPAASEPASAEAETAGAPAAAPADAPPTADEASAVSDDSGAAAAPPPEPEVDWTAIAARLRDRFQMEVDRRTPMFAPGESVELRMGNGLIRRGVFRGLDGPALQLESQEGGRDAIALDTLDRNTRLRVDAAYRDRYIEYLTRQRIAELRRAQAQER